MWQYPPRRVLAAVDFGGASTRALRIAEAVRAHGGEAVMTREDHAHVASQLFAAYSHVKDVRALAAEGALVVATDVLDDLGRPPDRGEYDLALRLVLLEFAAGHDLKGLRHDREEHTSAVA